MKYLKLLLLIPIFILNSVRAQPYVDILNIKQQHFFEQQLSTTSPQTRFSGDLQKATLLIPLVQKDSSVIIIGGNFTRLKFIYSGFDKREESLYSTSFQVGYNHQWKNKRWKTLGIFMTKVNTDFKSSSERFQLGGVFLINYKKSERVRYHLGLYYNRELFGNYFVPLYGIEWKASKRITVFGDLPATMNFEYKFSNVFYGGLETNTISNTYRVSRNDIDYIREGEGHLFAHAQIKLYLSWYFQKHIVLFAETGLTNGRVFGTHYNDNNPTADHLHTILPTNDGPFVTLGIAFRFRTYVVKNGKSEQQ